MRPTIAFLLLMGALLGPAYYAYCLFFSGEVKQSIALSERANRWETPDGSILRFANGMAYKPVSLTLTPEMNRIILRLRFIFGDSNDFNGAEQHYQASLAQLDHTVLERPFAISAKRDDTESIDIGPMEITYPAEYLFVLEQRSALRAPSKLTLEVIEKVETPFRPVIWAGMGLLLFAVILALRDFVRGTKSPATGAR